MSHNIVPTAASVAAVSGGGTIGLEFLSEVSASLSLVTISGDGSFWVATVRNT